MAYDNIMQLNHDRAGKLDETDADEVEALLEEEGGNESTNQLKEKVKRNDTIEKIYSVRVDMWFRRGMMIFIAAFNLACFLWFWLSPDYNEYDKVLEKLAKK